eukprot:343875-Chlamydomonas_euryale.AAC.2
MKRRWRQRRCGGSVELYGGDRLRYVVASAVCGETKVRCRMAVAACQRFGRISKVWPRVRGVAVAGVWEEEDRLHAGGVWEESLWLLLWGSGHNATTAAHLRLEKRRSTRVEPLAPPPLPPCLTRSHLPMAGPISLVGSANDPFSAG